MQQNQRRTFERPTIELDKLGTVTSCSCFPASGWECAPVSFELRYNPGFVRVDDVSYKLTLLQTPTPETQHKTLLQLPTPRMLRSGLRATPSALSAKCSTFSAHRVFTNKIIDVENEHLNEEYWAARARARDIHAPQSVFLFVMWSEHLQLTRNVNLKQVMTCSWPEV